MAVLDEQNEVGGEVFPFGVASVADRAAAGEGFDEPSELFPEGTVEGDLRTIKNLIKGSLPVKVTASLTAAKVPMTGGLPDPDRAGTVMVSYEPLKFLLVPQKDGEPGARQTVGWEIRCQLRSTYVEPGRRYASREQVVEILNQLGLTGSADAVAAALDSVFGSE